MPIEIQIDAEKGLVPRITKSGIRSIKTEMMRSIALLWHQTYSQFKFTTAAARKYNYTKRKTKEIRTGQVKLRKRSKKPLAPSGLPLVWTGETRRLAKIRTVRANSVRSSVTSPINKLNFKPKGAYPGLNMRKEYTTVLPSEERHLGRQTELAVRSMFSKGRKNINVITS